MVQFMPPVRRRLPRISATISTPDKPEGELADAGQRYLDRADQEAERHAEADGDVAELGGALDRIAEEFAQRREVSAIGEQADAVAELEHEVRPRQQVGVAAADLDDERSLLPRQVEIAERSADHRRPGREHAQIVEVAAILGEATRRRLAETPARLLEHLLARTDGEHDVVLGEDEVGRRGLVALLPAQRDDLHPRGQRGHQLAEPLAEELRVAHGDFEQLQCRCPRASRSCGFRTMKARYRNRIGPATPNG